MTEKEELYKEALRVAVRTFVRRVDNEVIGYYKTKRILAPAWGHLTSRKDPVEVLENYFLRRARGNIKRCNEPKPYRKWIEARSIKERAKYAKVIADGCTVELKKLRRKKKI